MKLVRFLNGNYDPILNRTGRKKCWKCIRKSGNAEKAIEYRELLASVQKIAQKKKDTDTAVDTDRDIMQWLREGEDAV